MSLHVNPLVAISRVACESPMYLSRDQPGESPYPPVRIESFPSASLRRWQVTLHNLSLKDWDLHDAYLSTSSVRWHVTSIYTLPLRIKTQLTLSTSTCTQDMKMYPKPLQGFSMTGHSFKMVGPWFLILKCQTNNPTKMVALPHVFSS